MPGREVVRQAVAQAPVASGAPVSKGQMIAQRVKAQRSLIVEALPTGIDVDRFVRIALTCFRTNEKLQDCDIDSVIGAVMQAAQLGLEPGNGRGLSWLVPYGRECQFQIGYKGYIDLFMRSPLFRSIEVREVRENDHFEYAYGLEDRLVHEPARGGVDRGRVTEYYGIARFASGGYYWVVVDLPEIERHRNRSKAKNNGPWVTDYQAMCAKTVIRIMHPYLPMSPEVAAAVAADGSIPARDEQGKVILDAHMAERAGAIGDVDYAPELPAARQSPPVTPPAAGERGPTSDGSQVGEPPASAPQPADDRANGEGSPAAAAPSDRPAEAIEATATEKPDPPAVPTGPVEQRAAAKRHRALNAQAVLVTGYTPPRFMALIRAVTGGECALVSDLATHERLRAVEQAVADWGKGVYLVEPDGNGGEVMRLASGHGNPVPVFGPAAG